MMWRAKISPDHNVSTSSQEEIGIFFTTFTGALMFGMIFRAQSVLSEPIKSADGGMREAAAKHASE